MVAGVPCQSFSFAGNRNRKNNTKRDSRDYLFKEVVRICKYLKPKVIVIENVKGILSYKEGKIKNTIIRELQKMNYKVDYKVLLASDYGTPQKRERALFIANRIGKENIFPKKTVHKPIPVGSVLKNIKGKNHEKRELKGVVLERVKLLKEGQNWKNLPKRLQTKSIHSGAYGRIDSTSPSRTLTTRFDTPSVGFVVHPNENRVITVREAARIQDFPDWFEFIGNLSSQCRQIGNAVPVKMSFSIAKSISKMLQ